MTTSTWTAPRHPARLLACIFGFASLALAPAARAAGLGEAGGVTISAERLFGYTHTKSEFGSGNGKTSGTRSNFAVLVASPSSVYSTPRVGLDVSIGNGLTVGGNFGFAVGSTTTSFSGDVLGIPVTSSADSDQTTFVLAPRAGYDLVLSDKLHLWGRGGITYFQSSNDGNTEVTTKGMALTLEPTFVYLPTSNVGITVGLTLDLPFSGERETELTNNTKTSVDNTYRQIGLLVGLLLNVF